MPIRMVVEIADEDWNAPTNGVRETMEHLCGLVGVADEDWNDPVFQEVWKEIVYNEIPRVVKVEKVRRLIACPPVLYEEEAQGAIEYILPAAGVIVAAVAMFALGGTFLSASTLLAVGIIAIGGAIFAIERLYNVL